MIRTIRIAGGHFIENDPAVSRIVIFLRKWEIIERMKREGIYNERKNL